MSLRFLPTSIAGVIQIEPEVFRDSRGFFLETFHAKKYAAGGIPTTFVQDNHSSSVRGTLRGLHLQWHKPQGKLVRVVSGEIFDVFVDLRKTSSTFGRWYGVKLSGENRLLAWIPAGFAHGFHVVSESAHVVYKANEFYFPELERTVLWNDPDLNIDWENTVVPLLSEKDNKGKLLKDAELFP